MARPLRIKYPGAFYHITSRGNEQRIIFEEQKDREKFLFLLESAWKRYGAIFHAYCLMSNHYHLLLETPEVNLSEILHLINSSYTTFFNRRHKRSGHLFQGRYKAILVEKDAYATQLSRYIHLNPVRIGLKERLESPYFTSFPFFVNKNEKPPWLETEFILSYFGKSKRGRRERYRAYVLEGLEKDIGNPLQETIASAVLGSKTFVDWIRQNLIVETESRDLPALRRLRPRPTIEEIQGKVKETLGEVGEVSRRVALYLCHCYTGKSLSEIGKAFGNISPSAVCQNTKRIKERCQKDKDLEKVVKGIEQMIKLKV